MALIKSCLAITSGEVANASISYSTSPSFSDKKDYYLFVWASSNRVTSTSGMTEITVSGGLPEAKLYHIDSDTASVTTSDVVNYLLFNVE